MEQTVKIEQVGLDWIVANPYQTREREDPAHVAKIAESILNEGLLQPPVGRRAGIKVQLAFGHTRAAAYRMLTQLGLHGESDGLDLSEFPGLARLLAERIAGSLANETRSKWLHLPMIVRELTDEEMFRLAVTENLARKDLTPIEEARAMQNYEKQFGKNSDQVGELFGVKGPTVRGKIMLLDLPDYIQEGFKSGSLSVGAARELHALLALPESMRTAASRGFYDERKPESIIRAALNGAMASTIHERVEKIVDEFSDDLSKMPWKHEEIILAADSGAPKDMPICAGCPSRMNRNKHVICLDRTCFWEKKRAWDWRYERQAAAAAGFPVLEKEWEGNQYGDTHTTFYGYGGQLEQTLNTAIAAKCPNLRVTFGGRNYESGGLEKVGFSNAMLVCKKRSGFCTCNQAVKAGVNVGAPAKPAEQPKEGEQAREVEQPKAAITSEELTEVARGVRKQKKADLAGCRDLLDRVAYIIGEGLFNKNPGTWKMILDHISYAFRNKEMNEQDIRFEIGKLIADRIFSPDGYEPKPVNAINAYNIALTKAGLPTISMAKWKTAFGVSMETEGSNVSGE